MASIDRTGALAALIRTQLATQRQPAVGSLNPGTTAREPSTHARTHTEAKSPADIDRQSWIMQQVRHLSPDDPRNKRKAFRIFLEAVLGQEFGPELIASSSFDQLVGQVLVQMEDDAELVLAMDEAGKQLLVEAGVVKTV